MFDSLRPWLPHWLSLSNAAMGWITGLSILTLFATAVAVPLILVYLPTDYFTRERRRLVTRLHERPVAFGTLVVSKNLLGAALLIAGLAMLVLPGQGLLTIFVAVMLLDFPRKYRFQRWLVTRERLFAVVNWLRAKAGRDPLEQPGE